MLQAFSTPRDRNRTLMLIAGCVILAVAALAVGIDDNPVGVTLAYFSAAFLVLAFVHPWRTPRQFRRLIYASVIVLGVSALLSNGLEAIAQRADWMSGALGAAGAFFFLAAVMLCPMGMLIGIFGEVLTTKRG